MNRDAWQIKISKLLREKKQHNNEESGLVADNLNAEKFRFVHSAILQKLACLRFSDARLIYSEKNIDNPQ